MEDVKMEVSEFLSDNPVETSATQEVSGGPEVPPESVDTVPTETAKVEEENSTKPTDEQALPKETVETVETKTSTSVESDGKPSESSELESLKKQIETLQGLVNKLSSTREVEKDPELQFEGTITPKMFEGLDIDSIMESNEKFIEFMVKSMNQVQQASVQQVLTSIPHIVGSFVQRQTSLRDVANEFYTKYPELGKVKQYVGTVANEVAAENPDWEIGRVLEETATRAMNALSIQRGMQSTLKKDTSVRPSLPGGTKTRQAKAPSTALQNEISELLEDF